MEGYAAAYHGIVQKIRDLERQAGEVLYELLDWAVIGLSALGGKVSGIAAFLWKVIPPVEMIQTVARVYMLWDIVKLAMEAVWDFEARVELGMLHGPGAAAAMPEVPSAPGIQY